MGVEVVRATPVKAPPIEAIVMQGAASRRGFKVTVQAGRVQFQGTHAGHIVGDKEHGWTVNMTRAQARELLADLTELVA